MHSFSFSRGEKRSKWPFSEGISYFSEGKLAQKSNFRGKKDQTPSGFPKLSRSVGMGSFTAFAQILERKIRLQMEKEASQKPSSSQFHSQDSFSQPELWTHLVGHIDPIHFQKDQTRVAYHRNRPPLKPRPDHIFNPQQASAFQFFNSHGATLLAANFSSKELKKAFRTLALRLHPDQGGTAPAFRSLLRARSELQSLFGPSKSRD